MCCVLCVVYCVNYVLCAVAVCWYLLVVPPFFSPPFPPPFLPPLPPLFSPPSPPPFLTPFYRYYEHPSVGDRGEDGVPERGSAGDEHQPALVVPLTLRLGGRRDVAPRIPRRFLGSGTIPVFELAENASPEENTDEVHSWILKSISSSVVTEYYSV